MIVCTFEDRPTDIIGLQLLVCSLAQHMPRVPIHVVCPVATPEFRAWLARFPQATLDEDQAGRGMGWDIKPHLLKRMLEAGHDHVVWMDSDIVVTRDFSDLLDDAQSLVLTEEYHVRRYGIVQRVTGWGLEYGRDIPGLNTGMVSVRPVHRPLLERWIALMAKPDYQAARKLPLELREPHLLGDQDVLVGLLASREFSGMKLSVLRRGEKIIQHYGPAGYPPSERLRHLITGMPPLIHSQGHKPWRFADVPSLWADTKKYFVFLYLELSPYAHFARRHQHEIPDFPRCFAIRSSLGRLSNALSFGQPSLRGFGHAAAASVADSLAAAAQRAKRMLGRLTT